MQVEITSHHANGKKEVFEGSDDDIRHQLLIAFPFLGSKYGSSAPLRALLAGLNACQAFSVVIPKAGLLKAEPPSRTSIADQLGRDTELDRHLAAAAFLAGSEPDTSALREAQVEHDGDDEAIALAACGLHVDEASRLALRGVLGASALAKADDIISGPQDVSDCVAATPDGEAFAATVRAAAKAGEVTPIQLGTGKHSRGTAVARDPENHHRILLKPGSGNLSSAGGVQDIEASQSKREAAFYAGAKAMGLERFVPEAHLLLIDGVEVAGLKLLPPPWRNMNQLRRLDAGAPRRLLSMYLPSGDLHRLAAMDYILGESDGHSGNVMSA